MYGAGKNGGKKLMETWPTVSPPARHATRDTLSKVPVDTVEVAVVDTEADTVVEVVDIVVVEVSSACA